MAILIPGGNRVGYGFRVECENCCEESSVQCDRLFNFSEEY